VVIAGFTEVELVEGRADVAFDGSRADLALALSQTAGSGARDLPRGADERGPAWRPAGSGRARRHPNRSSLRRRKALPAEVESGGVFLLSGGAPEPELVGRKGAEYARANLRFALLEFGSMRTANEHVLAREGYWKEVLLSREFGNNRN